MTAEGKALGKLGRQSIKLGGKNHVKENDKDKKVAEKAGTWYSEFPAVKAPLSSTLHSTREIPPREHGSKSLPVSTSNQNFPGFSLCAEIANFGSCCSWESTVIRRKYTLLFHRDFTFIWSWTAFLNLKKYGVWLMNMQLFMNRKSPQTVDN